MHKSASIGCTCGACTGTCDTCHAYQYTCTRWLVRATLSRYALVLAVHALGMRHTYQYLRSHVLACLYVSACTCGTFTVRVLRTCHTYQYLHLHVPARVYMLAHTCGTFAVCTSTCGMCAAYVPSLLTSKYLRSYTDSTCWLVRVALSLVRAVFFCHQPSLRQATCHASGKHQTPNHTGAQALKRQ
jgi:hypothetical protein